VINFHWQKIGLVMAVMLDKKKAGHIKLTEKGWQYFPLHARTGGEVFKIINECQLSLLEGAICD
jgi:hypothetical protein